MIAWLKGILRARVDEQLVIDVGGVGYAVQVPAGVLGQASLGDEVEVHVHTHVKEDTLALFGFDELAQMQAFDALLAVSGVGPRLAVSILSALSPAQLASAVETGDVARLKSAKGVGKRLAERLAVELKGKIEASPELGASVASAGAKKPAGGVWRDLRSALENLQYRPKEVDGAIDQIRRELPDGEFEELLRAALGILRR